MKVAVIAFAAVLAASAAQAKLTPFDGTREAKQTELPNVVSLYTGPAAAEMERNYFTAPQAAAERPGRCTVSTLVFAKVTLAQACY